MARRSTDGKIAVGTRIYNRGDMCNREHFGTITNIVQDRFCTEVTIRPDADAEREPYNVGLSCVHTIDKGNGSTRIVTLDAYKERLRNV